MACNDCKKLNCQECGKMTGCNIEITTNDVAPTLQYVFGLTADGCLKYSLPQIANPPQYFGCDNQPIAALTQIARCAEVDAKVTAAINALRLVGCDNLPVALNTPFVKCIEFAGQLCTALNALQVGTFTYGATELATANCKKVTIPQVSNNLSIVNGVITSVVNGVVAQAVVPTDTQVTNATISGTTLTVTESNGDVNQVDLANLLSAIITCDGTQFNRLGDRLVKCSQFSSLVVNDLSISGNILTSSVNGVSDSVTLPVPVIPNEFAVNVATPLTGNGLTGNPLDINFGALSANDRCALGNNIPNGLPFQYVGKDSTGCLVAQNVPVFPTQLAVTANAPITGNGLVTNPLALDFTLLTSLDRCNLGNNIPLGSPTHYVGKDGGGCLVSVVAPAQLPVSTTAPITGNGLVINPLKLNFSLLSAADKCAFGNSITELNPLTRILGKSADGCLSQYVIDCVCDINAPSSTFGLGCIAGGIGKVQFRERLSSVSV